MHILISKMAIVVVGTVNALVLHSAVPDDRLLARWTASKPPTRIRSAAGISLAAWLLALTLDRLVGYF
jgi:hypothetical protein